MAAVSCGWGPGRKAELAGLCTQGQRAEGVRVELGRTCRLREGGQIGRQRTRGPGWGQGGASWGVSGRGSLPRAPFLLLTFALFIYLFGSGVARAVLRGLLCSCWRSAQGQAQPPQAEQPGGPSPAPSSSFRPGNLPRWVSPRWVLGILAFLRCAGTGTLAGLVSAPVALACLQCRPQLYARPRCWGVGRIPVPYAVAAPSPSLSFVSATLLVPRELSARIRMSSRRHGRGVLGARP